MPKSVKDTARKFFEEQDRLRDGPAEALCSARYVAHLAGFPPMDLDGHKAFSTVFYEAFPDLKHSIQDVLAEGTHVAVRFRLTGTNGGSFMGAPATGKSVDVGGIALLKVADGKVAELRSEFDQLGLMQQIGALPAG